MIGLDRSGGRLKEVALSAKLAALGFQVDARSGAVKLEETPALKDALLRVLSDSSVIGIEHVQELEKLLGGRRSDAPGELGPAAANATLIGFAGRLTRANRELCALPGRPSRAQIQKVVHLFERLALDQDLQKLSDPKVLGAAQPKQLDALVDAYLDLAKAIGAFGPKHSAIMQVEPKLGKKLVDSFARVVARAPLFTPAPNTTNSRREVSPGFLHNMVALGHVRPVSSLDDPRLKDPQSLLQDGWVTRKFGDSTQFEFKDLDGKTLQRYSLDPGGRYIQSFHWVGAGQSEDELLRENLDGTTRRRTSDLNPLSINVDSLTGAPSWETVQTSAYRSYRSARIGDTSAFLGVGIRDDGSVVVQVTGNGKVLDAQIVATKEGRVIKKDLPSIYSTGHRREQEIGSRAIREHLQSMLEQLPAELKTVVPQLEARVVATRLT